MKRLLFVTSISWLTLASTLHAAGGSDACSTAEAISGVGVFAYDNTSATTGAEGQQSGNCLLFGVNGIARDVWFAWTAPATGKVTISNCLQTISDSKMAMYTGTTCPGPGTTALACSEDLSDFVVQPMLFVSVTAGQTYLIQLGCYPGNGTDTPGAPAPGTFTIAYDGPTSTSWDDGTSENIITWGFDGDVCWLAQYGFPGQTTTVSGVSVAFGSPVAASGLPNGTPAKVALWDDPNDDGDPSDAVLLATANTTVQNVDQDAFNLVSFAGSFTVHGVYFVGANVAEAPGRFPAPLDARGCTFAPRRAWIARNFGAPFDFTTLTANSLPPRSMHTVGGSFRGVWLLRAVSTGSASGVPFCGGDGTLVVCPCGNVAAAGSVAGCLNSQGTSGLLTAVGVPSLTADSIQLNGASMPFNSPALYFQGGIALNSGAGAAFGDGVMCLTGTIVRLGAAYNTGGASHVPNGPGASISVRGGVTSPGPRQYQVIYRDVATFCTAATFNLTNAWSILWTP